MSFNLKYNFKCSGLQLFVVIWFVALNLQCIDAALKDFESERAKEILKYAKAADIKNFMNLDVDPCDDFYEFACGNWKKINPAQNGKVNTDKFLALNSGIERRLTELLEKNNSPDGGQAEDKVRDFYHSCLLTKSEKSKYLAELSKVYKELGEFSAFKEKVLPLEEEQQQLNKTNNFHWWSTVAKIQNRYGQSTILSVNIFDDIKDKSKTNMAYIGQPEFKLTQEDNLDRIAQYLHLYLKIDSSTAKRMAENIVSFEFDLIQGATDSKSGKSVSEMVTLYNTTDVQEKYRNLFDVREYLELTLGTKRLPNQVYVYDESYLEGLHEVFNSTEDDVVQDYILWLFLEEFLVNIVQPDMREDCLYQTKKFFGKFIDHVIYNKYRSNKTEAEIYDLWQDIKEAFEHNLQSDKYYWINKATREEAIRKLLMMNLTINSYDNENFIELFKSLDIDVSNYVVNVKNILEHTESQRENKLEKKTESDPQMLSFTPVYNVMDNRIKIPVFLLQPFYLWTDIYPRAVQYGTLGYFLAHEMIHGFDDEGRNYDPNGQAQNWWDEKSAYEFDSRRKCFKEQYHKYKYNGRYLPESDSQSENIADNGGVNIAYDAYKLWLFRHNEEKMLKNETFPNLTFNNRQLFFISFAQLWCEDAQPEFKTLLANTDLHAPAELRVIGTLSNSREFTWLFKCNTKKYPMNPAKKCEIY